MKTVAVIPARYCSSRFPGKPLADLCGMPMLWWVWKRVSSAHGIDELYIATDDERIAEACRAHGMEYRMTKRECATSTERIWEVAQQVPADYYIAVNGDEPLIDPRAVSAVIPSDSEACSLLERQGFYVGNLMTKIMNPVEVVDPTNIKVVSDCSGCALLFSRSPVPFPKASMGYCYRKHVGVLAYSKEALRFFAETKKGPLECAEDVNELRFLEHGKCVRMTEVNYRSLSVDTPKDLVKVKEVLETAIARGEVELPCGQREKGRAACSIAKAE